MTPTIFRTVHVVRGATNAHDVIFVSKHVHVRVRVSVVIVVVADNRWEVRIERSKRRFSSELASTHGSLDRFRGGGLFSRLVCDLFRDLFHKSPGVQTAPLRHRLQSVPI